MKCKISISLWLVVLGSLLSASCQLRRPTEVTSVPEAAPAQEPSTAFRRDKIPPVDAQGPARGLDIVDPTGGRLTLVEMHRQTVREVEGLKSELRAQQQQIAALESDATAFGHQMNALREELAQSRSQREDLEKEKQELVAKLLDANFKQVEAERQLLQIKISTLKEKRVALQTKRAQEMQAAAQAAANQHTEEVEMPSHAAPVKEEGKDAKAGDHKAEPKKGEEKKPEVKKAEEKKPEEKKHDEGKHEEKKPEAKKGGH